MTVRGRENELESVRESTYRYSRAFELCTSRTDYYLPITNEEASENMDTDSGAAADLGGGDSGEEKDPFAQVQSDPLGNDAAGEVEETAEIQEGTLGGTGATLEELEPEAELAEAEAAEEDAPAAAEPEAEPEPAAAEPEPEASAVAEPEPPAPTGKVGTSEREYVVQRQDGKDDDGNREWVEVTRIKAANGEVALRQAYAALVPSDSEEAVTLVVIPAYFFHPKTVKAMAKVNRAIEIA